MELPAELEAAIRQAPDERDGYLVAADWLSSKGDPQGELIALSLAAQPDDAIRSRIADLQKQLKPIPRSDRVRLEWRWGFVVGVTLSAIPQRERALLRAVLQSPVSRFLRNLGVVDDANEPWIDGMLDEHARALGSLQ